MVDHRAQINRLRQRIDTEAADAITIDDAEALEDFSDQLELLKSQYSDARHNKLLRHLVRMAEHVGGLADALEEREAAEEIVRWINREYDNEETNRDYRVALRVFGLRVTDGDEPPESIDWVPATTSSNYDPSPEPRDMLHWDEHIMPMVESCYNARDRAMLTLQWDAGLRAGEFKSLTYGDVTDHEHGLQVTVAGKQGRRTVTLVPSVPHVSKWLDAHPTKGGDDPLWCSLHEPFGEMTNTAFHTQLSDIAERADVERPVTLTNFRKSSASYLASEGMSQAHLEDHHGWVRGSTAAARYVAVFADAGSNELARIHGKDVSDTESEPIGPIECPRCGRDTPRERDFCVWCNQALSTQATAELDETKGDVVEALATADDEEKRRLFAKFLSWTETNPDVSADGGEH